MKKFFMFILAAVAALFTLTPVTAEESEVKLLTVAQSEVTLNSDGSYDLTVTVDGLELFGGVDYKIDSRSLQAGVKVDYNLFEHSAIIDEREVYVVDEEEYDEVFIEEDGERVVHHDEVGHYETEKYEVRPAFVEERPVITVPDKAGTYTLTLIGVNEYQGAMTASITVEQTVSSTPAPVNTADSAEESSLAEQFVCRLYELCLGRQGDEYGIANWTYTLTSGTSCAASVCMGFFTSAEMAKLNLSNEEFVSRCYRVMFDRSGSEREISGWAAKLVNGVSRRYVLAGFLNSAEFARTCKAYGVKQGSLSVKEMRDKNYGLTSFISRLYTKALGRSYDIAGLNGWCGKILSGTWRPIDVATSGFFHSQEFYNRNLNNSEFVKVLYRTFLDREAEAAGLKGWVGKLNKGTSRDSIISGFANSQEFANLMDRYGF